MTVVTARRYRQGKIQRNIAEAPFDAPGKGEFDWIGLLDPEPAEIDALAQRYHLHPLAVEDAVTQRHPPKAETYSKHLFVVARTAAQGPGDTIAYGQTAIFVGDDFIITVRLGSQRAHVDLRAQLEANPERLAEGPDFVLHALLDFIVEGFDPLLDRLDETMGKMEDGAIDAFPDQARIRRIFRLRRTLRQLEGISGRMEEMTGKLAQVEQPAIDQRARPYFRDVHDHARRVLMRTRALLDTLGNLLEVASLLEQSRQGAITRQLAAWAAILAVPTAIAGIYGMNFAFMPELAWRHGYFIVLGAIALICALLFWRFRRIGWL
ncbi:magnesium and cobalt transport protein CorA [Alteraurantiacibacter aquimixticola]|uniref:Magnesium and cobalt transport protein CorA n=1 Tax=Alteraurantiacibacter aquimixticola TaxID=2489173 RepID=A0A4T3F4D3_9SPHN|nr:magnesium and cobalt transport protein CorA [Alteraurantiacibacter aquimixticola]TIX49563.1 magnesium and cobalt transport protein CorA [Alteraurantiacibacter aquimixticola]